jgi:hypothetical protein
LIFTFLFYLLFLQGSTTGINVAKEGHVAGALSGVIVELTRRWLINRKQQTYSYS